jgi:hypothetical protein
MSYYRFFGNLVAFLGLITMGLILAAVYIGFDMPRSGHAPIPFPPDDSGYTSEQESPALTNGFDRNALAPLKAPVPVAPPREFDPSRIPSDVPAHAEQLDAEEPPDTRRDGQPAEEDAVERQFQFRPANNREG